MAIDSILNLRKFLAPEIIFGNGSRKLAGQYCRNFNISKVLLVTDPGVVRAGWPTDVVASLEEAGVESVLYSSVTPNPRELEVMDGVQVFQKNECQAIVSVGGGSPMDCAKGIGIVVENGGHILDYEGMNKVEAPLPPMIFIPTTAGTSADVSQFCIITNKTEKVKIAIVSKIVIPDVALIDPETTTTMDPILTACTGMDAMVHAVEAFLSSASSRMTDVHALKAIEILRDYLPGVVEHPLDAQLREHVMFASMEAGLAFSNAALGAVHAMAHSMGGLLDLPHGKCNSLLLEHVINYNYSSSPERCRVIADTLGIQTKGMTGETIRTSLFKKVHEMRSQLGITQGIGQAGVSSTDIPALAKNAIHDACMLTNPRKAEKRDIEVIYEEAI